MLNLMKTMVAFWCTYKHTKICIFINDLFHLNIQTKSHSTLMQKKTTLYIPIYNKSE